MPNHDRPTVADASPWGFAEWFVIAQVVLPALLYLPGTQALRVPLRIAPFALSLLGLAQWLSRAREPAWQRHSACIVLVGVIGYLGLMIFHPTTNSLMAGMAQAMLYLSVMAPVFWMPALIRTPGQLARLIGILLVCNGVNACVGVLQVYDPDRWMPAELSRVVQDAYDLGSLSYRRADGRTVLRPPGLSDNPGAVCGPGAVAGLLGLVFCTLPIPIWKKGLCLMLAVAGGMAILLSQVRTSLLILLGSLVTYGGMLYLERRIVQAVSFLALTGSLALLSFVLALTLGGESISERLGTLTESDPIETYYKTGRGEQLAYAWTGYAFDYPLGAGLGRWGMMRHYFGDPNNLQSPPIWAELQYPAWILDGGLVLAGLYTFALLRAARYDFHLSLRHPNPQVRNWATVVLASNMGSMALIFGYTPFTNQVGLQYWVLAGALHGVASALGSPTDRAQPLEQANLSPPRTDERPRRTGHPAR